MGKTHLATALGHIAIRRRKTVAFYRADKLFTRLRAARLDNTLEAEIRRLAGIDVLIIDDFALRPLDATQTGDFHELVVERHRRASTIWISNRKPSEWLGMTTDALLTKSAVDRPTSGAQPRRGRTSCRQRERVTVAPCGSIMLTNTPRRFHARGNTLSHHPDNRHGVPARLRRGPAAFRGDRLS